MKTNRYCFVQIFYLEVLRNNNLKNATSLKLFFFRFVQVYELETVSKDNKLTIESDVKLKYWNRMAKTKKTIPTTIPNDSGLQKLQNTVIKDNKRS